MPKLQIPGPVENQMSVEDFGARHVELQSKREPEKAEVGPHQSQPPMQGLKLDNPQLIEQYRESVREAMKYYAEERQLGHEHSKHNAKVGGLEVDEERGKRIEGASRRDDLREKSIGDAERQIEVALKAMNPANAEKLRPLVDKYLEQVIELSNVGTPPLRPGLERIENKGVLMKGMGPVASLEMSRDGNYSLVGQDGQRMPAHGDYAFAINVSNPTQIRVGSREQGGHMALTGGGDVYFAGELHFQNGKLVSWDNGSGHYMPSNDQKRQVSETAISSLESLLPRDKYKSYNG